MPYTIGVDRSKGQVVPSEGSTQATEARWAHLRDLFHRGCRRFGRDWLLSAFVDDQIRLVFGDEHLLPEDLQAERGQSLLSKELEQARLDGLTREVDKNMVVTAWVMKLPGVTDSFKRFEKLFLQPGKHGIPTAVTNVPGANALIKSN